MQRVLIGDGQLPREAHCLGQRDSLVRAEFHYFCQSRSVDTAAYHHSQSFRSAKEIYVLRDQAGVSAGVKSHFLRAGMPDFGQVGNVDPFFISLLKILRH